MYSKEAVVWKDVEKAASLCILTPLSPYNTSCAHREHL